MKSMLSVSVYTRFQHVGSTLKLLNAKQFLPIILFIMLYKVVPTFESVGENLKCDYSNESY